MKSIFDFGLFLQTRWAETIDNKGNDMKGTIYMINLHRGMVAVQTENGDFSVFELLANNPVEKGDEVQWKDDTSLGSTMLMNLTQRQTYEVYFQNHWVSSSQLKQQLLIE